MSDVNKDYIKAAEVYLKLGQRSVIVIKCCLCSTVGFTDWSHFACHLNARHSGDGTSLDRYTELNEEIQVEVELEERNLRHKNSTEFSGSADSDSEADIQEYLSSEGDQVDKDRTFDQPCGNNNIVNKPKQPFYALQQTNPELMHYFIDLLHQHKYLWCNEYRNMDFKTERFESAEQISRCLAHRFNVSLTPQIICLSSCALLNWFKKQYALCKGIPGHRTRHKQYYDRLLEFVPTDDTTVVYCEECDRRFFSEDQLRRHKHRIHFGSHPYKCDVCDKEFTHACKLRMHRTRFHMKYTRWKCTKCNYCAPNKWDLRTHFASHVGDRNYTCEICGVSTKSSSSLAVHRRTHGNPKIRCPYCPKEYRENSLLKSHLKKAHTDEMEENN